MAVVLRTQLTVALTALGVGVVVVYLLQTLPLRSSITPAAKPLSFTSQQRRQPLQGPALANPSDHRIRRDYNQSSMADSLPNGRTQNNGVRRFHWPSEASAKAHGQRTVCKYLSPDIKHILCIRMEKKLKSRTIIVSFPR